MFHEKTDPLPQHLLVLQDSDLLHFILCKAFLPDAFCCTRSTIKLLHRAKSVSRNFTVACRRILRLILGEYLNSSDLTNCVYAYGFSTTRFHGKSIVRVMKIFLESDKMVMCYLPAILRSAYFRFDCGDLKFFEIDPHNKQGLQHFDLLIAILKCHASANDIAKICLHGLFHFVMVRSNFIGNRYPYSYHGNAFMLQLQEAICYVLDAKKNDNDDCGITEDCLRLLQNLINTKAKNKSRRNRIMQRSNKAFLQNAFIRFLVYNRNGAFTLRPVFRNTTVQHTALILVKQLFPTKTVELQKWQNFHVVLIFLIFSGFVLVCWHRHANKMDILDSCLSVILTSLHQCEKNFDQNQKIRFHDAANKYRYCGRCMQAFYGKPCCIDATHASSLVQNLRLIQRSVMIFISMYDCHNLDHRGQNARRVHAKVQKAVYLFGLGS